MSAFATYLIGFIIVVGGLAYAGVLLGVPVVWIVVGVVVLAGLGIVSATRNTKMRDTADGPRTGPTSPAA